MNRTIKFRGKRIDTGEWVYGDLLQVGNLCCIGRSIETFTKMPFNECVVDPETIGQYTGLKDRNGKEIYEGDILLLSDKDTHQELAVVEHGLYGWTFYNPKTVLRYEDGSHTYKAVENCRFMFGTGKIIGNIHDNPELLKDGK